MRLTTSEGEILLTDAATTAVEPSFVSEVSTDARAAGWARRYVAALVGADLAAALISTLVCWIVRPNTERRSVLVLDWHIHYWMLALVVTPIWLAALASGGAYRRRHASQGLADYRLPAVTALRLAGAISILSFAFHTSLSRLLVVVYFPVLLGTSLVLRCACRQALSALRRRGLALRRLLLVGDAACVAKFARYLRSPAYGYQLVGACIPGDASFVGRGHDRLDVVGPPDSVIEAAQRRDVDTVLIVGHPGFEETTLQEITWRIERSGRTLLVGPDVVELAGPRISPATIGRLPLLHIGDPLIGVHRQTIKAAYERTLGLLLVVLLSPVFALVALAILIDSGRPIFYRQERVGFRKKPFTIVKFRTMVLAAEAMQEALRESNDHDGGLFKIRDDPRVTRVGRWLRRCSLDELPQLLNVVKGDMVLIGPRPVLPAEARFFGEAAQRRFLARPGLTGLWQVSGRSDIPWEEAVRLDLYYVENWSPWMDLMIVWRTLGVVVSGSGGY